MSKIRNLLFKPPDIRLSFLYGKKLLLGFSGGKDSTAMLHYFSSYSRQYRILISACHINHNLRGAESLRDAEFCKKRCEESNIPFVLKTTNVYDNDLERGIENAARYSRYKLLEEARIELGYDYILTAHTLDDQIESFFVDLFTGVSIFTLGGISVETGRILRPFLNISTDMVLEYIQANNLEYIYDSSNDNNSFVRNRVRNELIPIIKDFDYNAMSNSIFNLQHDSTELNDLFNKRLSPYQDLFINDGVLIKRNFLDRISSLERSYIIGKWLSIFCRGGRKHLMEILSLYEKGMGRRLTMPGGYLCEVSYSGIRIFPANLVSGFCINKPAGLSYVALPDGRGLAFHGLYIDKELILRTRTGGEVYRGRSVKKIFNDLKLDLYDRDRALMIYFNNEIIWLEHKSAALSNCKDGFSIVKNKI